MTRSVRWAGFEDLWYAPGAIRRTPEEILSPGRSPAIRARVARLVRRAPEVMVKVSGRTRDTAHLLAHLDYINRHGGLALEGRDGTLLDTRDSIRDVADDWGAMAMADSRRRATTPVSVSVVLSMPAGTSAFAVRDAARDFAASSYPQFDYVFALHTDAPHPHVHLAIRALGEHGERLNPKKADLAAWREAFAQALRDRGAEAEATPRRARGVLDRNESVSARRLRERHGKGQAAESSRRASDIEPGLETVVRPGATETLARQRLIRRGYLLLALQLSRSESPQDRGLGAELLDFVAQLPKPDWHVRSMGLGQSGRRALKRSERPPGRER